VYAFGGGCEGEEEWEEYFYFWGDINGDDDSDDTCELEWRT
jgi:hypothetical protein